MSGSLSSLASLPHQRTTPGSSPAKPDRCEWNQTHLTVTEISATLKGLSFYFLRLRSQETQASLIKNSLLSRIHPRTHQCGQEMLFADVQLHINSKRAYLLNQHIEGFWHRWLHPMVAIHDVFIHLCPAGNVVRFDGKHLL